MDEKIDMFINHLHKHIENDQITTLYQANGITYEKTVLYGDFIKYVVNLCFSTYMGDDITDSKHKKEHFNWCWEKANIEFNQIGISFINNNELKDYLWGFLTDLYYNTEEKDKIIKNINIFFNMIFNYSNKKSRADIDCFLGVYLLCDKSMPKTI